MIISVKVLCLCTEVLDNILKNMQSTKLSNLCLLTPSLLNKLQDFTSILNAPKIATLTWPGVYYKSV